MRLLCVLNVLVSHDLPQIDQLIQNGKVNYNMMYHIEEILRQTENFFALEVLRQTMGGKHNSLHFGQIEFFEYSPKQIVHVQNGLALKKYALKLVYNIDNKPSIIQLFKVNSLSCFQVILVCWTRFLMILIMPHANGQAGATA